MVCLALELVGSRVVFGFSARGEGERVLALESREGLKSLFSTLLGIYAAVKLLSVTVMLCLVF